MALFLYPHIQDNDWSLSCKLYLVCFEKVDIKKKKIDQWCSSKPGIRSKNAWFAKQPIIHSISRHFWRVNFHRFPQVAATMHITLSQSRRCNTVVILHLLDWDKKFLISHEQFISRFSTKNNNGPNSLTIQIQKNDWDVHFAGYRRIPEMKAKLRN